MLGSRLFAVLLCLGFSACGGAPDFALTPVSSASAPGTSQVTMLVATNRRAHSGGTLFSGERGRVLGFAEVGISIPPDSARTVGEVQRASRGPGDPAKDFVATKAEVLDFDRAYRRFTEMLAEPRNNGRALIFVHGYNTRFGDAVLRFAQIVHDSKVASVPVLFTWPSRGELVAYPYDRESGNFSRDALEAALEQLSKDSRVKQISILAHSMGNWVTLEALRTMALKNKRVHPKIVDVMLAAPDVDVDVFHTQLRALGSQPPRMTLFVARDDKALGVSRKFWGDIPRLGAIDPTEEPYRADIEKARITVIDLTKVKGEDFLNHGKFAESPEVVRLIGHRLSQGQTLHDDASSVSDQFVSAATDTGAGLAKVTGQVISTPLRIIDSR